MAQPVAEQRRPVALVLHYIHANARNDVLLKLPGYRELMEEMKAQLISSEYKVIVKEYDETEEAVSHARVLGSKIRGVFSKFSKVKDVWGVEEQEVVVKNLVIWRAKQYFSQGFRVPRDMKNDFKKKNINLSFVCLGRVSQGERQAFTQCLQGGRTDNPQEWKHWDSTLPPCLLTGFRSAPRASTSTSGVAPPGLEASIVGASGSTSVSGTSRSLPATSNLANAASLARGYLAYPIVPHTARPVHPRAVSLQRYVHPTGHHQHSPQWQIALPSLYPRQRASMLPVEYPDYAEPSIPGLRKRARANTEPPSPVKHCRTELQAADPSADEFSQWIDVPEGQYGYYAEASGFITPPLSVSTSEASTSSAITPPLELGVANVATSELDALSYNTSVSQWHLQLAQASNNAPGAVFHEAGNPFFTTHTEHQAGYHDEGFLLAGLAQLDETSSVASEERIAWNDKGKGKAVPVNNAHLARSPEIQSNTITHSSPQTLGGQSAVVSPQISVPSQGAAEECALHATVQAEQSQVHFGGETIPKSAAHPLLSQYHGDLLDLMLSYPPDPPSDNSPPPPVNAADCQQGDGGILPQVISGDDNGMVGGSSISRQTFVDITGGDKVASGSGAPGRYEIDDADHTLPCVDRFAIAEACGKLVELSLVNPRSPILFEFFDWVKAQKTELFAAKHVQTELPASEQQTEDGDARGKTVVSGEYGAEKLSKDSAKDYDDEGNEITRVPHKKEIGGSNASTGECSENAGPELHDDSGNVCLTTFASDVVENSEKLITDAVVGPSFAENERSAETADDVRHEDEEDESENQAKGEEQEEHQDEVVREDHDQDGDEGNREDDGLSGACLSGDISSSELLTFGILEAFPGLDDHESGYL
ncbi:uncharacterized protein LAESUDRAFT_446560 [Laetiporus sulphureus 93-53]|uniref:Uncharacterized protein n=1 Tax=Laetiporus sulphureus 93-53 TaxID=1314785 RepID=A0A165BXZ8_9APHY|nr:uncharacterized protein LAESUDRAFT_446560 [Laetiporus sulphureus 93-53]KZT01855.1 hypothetical protein LAESUDRAFT_446560 [Laetiporus sulphureus 93-53]